MKRSFKIALLSGVWLAHALIAMQPAGEEAAPARSTSSTQSQLSQSEVATTQDPEEALRESEKDSEMLTFYWKNEQGERKPIGQVPAWAAKAISPVYKAQLEVPFAGDRYSVVLSEEHTSKESALMFVDLLSWYASQLPLSKSIWGPYVTQHQYQISPLIQSRLSLWLESNLRRIYKNPSLILELIGLCDQFQITAFNSALNAVLARIIGDPAWYNLEQSPLSEINDIVREQISRYPYNMAMIRNPIIVRHNSDIRPERDAVDRYHSPIEFSPNDRYMHVTFQGGTVLVDLDSTPTITEEMPKTSLVVFSPDSKYVILIDYLDTYKAHIYDLQAKHFTATIQYDDKRPIRAKFSDDSRYLAISYANTMLQIYDLQTNQNISTIQRNIFAVKEEFSADNRYLVSFPSLHTKDEPHIYDLQTRKVLDKTHQVPANIHFNQPIYGNNRYRVHQAQQFEATVLFDDHPYIQHLSPNNKYLAVVLNDSRQEVRVIPFGFDQANINADQILAMVTLIRLAFDKRHDPLVPITLHRDGWVYKTFNQLPNSVKNRLQEQYPEIRNLINQAVGGNIAARLKKGNIPLTQKVVDFPKIPILLTSEE